MRNLCYVAVTRAIKNLVILYTDDETPIFDKVWLLLIYLIMVVTIFLLVMVVKNSLQRLSIWNDYMNIAIEDVERNGLRGYPSAGAYSCRNTSRRL